MGGNLFPRFATPSDILNPNVARPAHGLDLQSKTSVTADVTHNFLVPSALGEQDRAIFWDWNSPWLPKISEHAVPKRSIEEIMFKLQKEYCKQEWNWDTEEERSDDNTSHTRKRSTSSRLEYPHPTNCRQRDSSTWDPQPRPPWGIFSDYLPLQK